MRINGALTFAMLVALAALIPSVGNAQATYEAGRQYWIDGNYTAAIETFLAYREKPNGRTAEVDYMLGTSACRLPEAERRQLGAKILDLVLYNYPLTADSRRTIEAERRACAQTLAERPSRSTPVEFVPAGLWAKGKTFYWIDRQVPVASYPARRVAELKPEEFARRLVSLGARDRARELARTRLQGCTAEAAGEVLLCSTVRGITRQDLQRSALGLERYIRWLRSAFGVTSLDHFANIFLVPSVGDLRQFARRQHGLDVSPATIGYAFRDDQSVVAVVQNADTLGTVLHELWHLLVRRDFGDIPQWLDEGIASLYEVSTTHDPGIVVGQPNWRGEIIRTLDNGGRTSLREVLLAPWYSDAGRTSAESDEWENAEVIQKQAVELALARYFMLYLQETGHLREVFRQIRDAPIPDRARGGEFSLEVVERVTGKRLDQIQTEIKPLVTRTQRLDPSQWMRELVLAAPAAVQSPMGGKGR
jgi:hypothetical protein